VTTFAVTFTTPHAGGVRSDLSGPGTVTLSTTGIVVAGAMPRKRLAMGVAGVFALTATFFALLFAADLLDDYVRSGGDMRLFVAIGLVIMVGSFAAVRALLLKLLPKRAFEATLSFPFVAWLTPKGDRVEMLTNAATLAGVTAFETGEAGRFVEEFEVAKRGPQRGYRATP